MGATSVTGTGDGASWAGQKGPHNNRDIFVPQNGAHVVCSGRNALVGGALTITFPTALTGSHTNYVVHATAENDTSVTVGTKTDSSSNFVSFALTGTTTATIGWTVVKTGLA